MTLDFWPGRRSSDQDALRGSHVLMGKARGPVAFMARHGRSHGIPPHLVNYRANIWALDSIGATGILATAAVGSLRRELAPGSFLLLDQFIDFTKTRISTFGGQGNPCGFYPALLSSPGGYLVDAARRLGSSLKSRAVMFVRRPRYETLRRCLPSLAAMWWA